MTDFPASQRPAAHLIMREVLSYLGGALLMPFGRPGSDAPTERRAEQRTVVLVHGYLAGAAQFHPLAAYLRRRGVGRVLAFDYRSRDGLEASAIALKQFLRTRVRGGRIDLVCHSAGGLVARVYLQLLGGARRVDRCITLGTPHGGTYSAYWLPSRVGHDLRPGSALLARVADSAAAAERVRFTSVVAGADTMVVPRVLAAHGEVLLAPDCGHVGLLFAPSVWRVVADRLEHAA